MKELSVQEIETIESLIKYPSLETLFDAADTSKLFKMRQNLKSTIFDSERVIRIGDKSDAEKATKVLEACQIMLKFLEELENLR